MVIQPHKAALSFALSRNIAHCCALAFYNLEVTALLQGMLPARDTPPEPLSKREQEVLELLCNGYDRRTIAQALHITRGTLGKHFEI